MSDDTKDEIRAIIENAEPFIGQGMNGDSDPHLIAEHDFEPFWPFEDRYGPIVTLDGFPPMYRSIIEGHAIGQQIPLVSSLLISMGLIAITGQRKFEVQGPKRRWRETTNLWTQSIMRSGAGKTPSLSELMYAISEAESLFRTKHAVEIRRDAALLQSAERRLKILSEKHARESEPEDRHDLESEMKAASEDWINLEGTAVRPLSLFTADITPEAMVELLCTNDERAAVVTAEGAQFFQGMGRYQNNGDPNMTVYLEGWSGDKSKVHRVGRGEFILERPSLSLVLLSQPKVLADARRNPGLGGRGLLERFIHGVPKPMVGYRDPDAPALSKDAGDAWDAMIAQFLADKGDRQLIELSADALFEFRAFRIDNEKDLRPGGKFGREAVEAWGSKLPGTVLRIAFVLHRVDCYEKGEDPRARPISAQTIDTAILLSYPLADHASIALEGGGGPTEAHSRKVWDWISRPSSKREDPAMPFSARDAHQGARVSDVNMAGTHPALALLVERGYVRKRPQPPRKEGQRGQNPSPVYEVNPEALERKEQ